MKKTKQAKENFFDWNYNILLNAIKKIDLNIIFIVILDAVFYLLSSFLALFWLQRVQSQMASFALPQDIMSLGAEGAKQLANEIRTFYFLIILSLILLLIAIIFLASILKGIIWAKTIKTKLTFNLISRFLILNLIWMGFWFALMFLIFIFVQPQMILIFTLIALALGLYFTNTVYTIFMKKQSLKSILDAVKTNILNIRLFLLPYTLIFLLFYLIVKVSSFAIFKYSGIVFSVILLFYIAIVRFYASDLVEEMSKIKDF